MVKQRVKVLDAATATNSPPTLATAGFDTNALTFGGRTPSSCTFAATSTAGSGTMTVTLKAWGYDNTLAVWCPLGTNATATSKGLLNDGNAIGEISADLIRHAEILDNPCDWDRLYFEITAIGGTATAITAYLIATVEG